MTSARQRRAAMHARNAGLQRLRSITKRVGIATTVLTGIFAGLAAAGNSGHHHRRTVSRAPATTEPATSTTVPAPPGLPPLREDGGQSAPAPSPTPAQSPAPPPQAPVQTEQPPVVTSGGS